MKNREIKFRGLHNGEWCYGYYFKHPTSDTHSIFLSDGNGSRIVDKESVGQYIGLKDKIGVDVYEDDIVKSFSIDEGETIDIIGFDSGQFVLINPEKLSWPVGDYAHSNIEVIGNIYHNPELVTPPLLIQGDK